MNSTHQKFKPSEAHQVNRQFKMYFGIAFESFFLGFIFHPPEILIDLIKFDNYLIEKYAYKGSMSDFIKSKFGKEAHEFLLKLI